MKRSTTLLVALVLVASVSLALGKSPKDEGGGQKNREEYKKSRIVKLELVDNLSGSSMSDEKRVYLIGRDYKQQKSFFAVTKNGDVYILFPYLREVRKYDRDGEHVANIVWSRPEAAIPGETIMADDEHVYLVNRTSVEAKSPFLINADGKVRKIHLEKKIKKNRHVIKDGVAYEKWTGKKVAVIHESSDEKAKDKAANRRNVWDIKIEKAQRKNENKTEFSLRGRQKLEVDIDGYRVRDGEVVAVDDEGSFYIVYVAADDSLSYDDGVGGIRYGGRYWIAKYGNSGGLLVTIELEISYIDPDIAVLANGDIYQYHPLNGKGYSVTKWSRH